MTDATTEETGNGDASPPDESEVALFGDPRSAEHVARGPDRRASHRPEVAEPAPEALHTDEHHIAVVPRSPTPGRALRLGRGDGWATALTTLGIIVFAASVISGGLILNNAQAVGAFSDPWNSNRVAIGLAVLGVGISQAALLIGVARAITYQLATLRLKMYELDHAGESHSHG